MPPKARILDLGCGNGYFASLLAAQGYEVTGIDPSASGIALATAAHPTIRFEQGSIEDDLAGRLGQFDAVTSLEVIEHCYSARSYALCLISLLKPGGLALISTPYHGYLKNLALAVSGHLPAHMDPLWEGGHIKFFTVDSLTRLLTSVGFAGFRVQRTGRWLPALAKSMIVTTQRPTA